MWEEPFVKGRMYKAYNNCTSEELKEMFNRAIIVARYPRFDRNDNETVVVGDIVSGSNFYNIVAIISFHLYM